MKVNKSEKSYFVSIGCSLLIFGGVSSADAALITYAVEGDITYDSYSEQGDVYHLNGAHFKWVVEVDSALSPFATTRKDSLQLNLAYFKAPQALMTFTSRSDGAEDIAITPNSTNLQTSNYDLFSANSDGFRLGGSSLSFEGLANISLSSFHFSFTSDVYGEDGFASIPAAWTLQQLLYPEEFAFDTKFSTTNDDEEYSISNVEYSVTTVPVPTAVWLFGSGLIGLIGIARRKKS